MLSERAAGAGHHGERRAQIMGYGGEQRVAQGLTLGGDGGLFRHFRQPRALDSECDLPGEGLQQVALLG